MGVPGQASFVEMGLASDIFTVVGARWMRLWRRAGERRGFEGEVDDERRLRSGEQSTLGVVGSIRNECDVDWTEGEVEEGERRG